MPAPKQEPLLDVSVVLPFSDHEEHVGRLSVRIAEHLRTMGLRFELLAVDEGSADNSFALLSLLRSSIPELSVHQGSFAGAGRVARGKTLWLLCRCQADLPLAAFGRANGRVSSDEADLVHVAGLHIVARRTQVWRLIDHVGRTTAGFERRMLFGARLIGLRTDSSQPSRFRFWQLQYD